MNDSETPDLPEEQLPHEVVAALQKSYGPLGQSGRDAEDSVPESVDKAILADAAAHLRTISSVTPARKSVAVPWYRRPWVTVTAGTLAAAMLLFMVWPGSGSMDAMRVSQSDSASSLIAGNERKVLPEAEMQADISGEMQLVANDIDRNGDVNILDAFALARALDASNGDTNAGGGQWDQNGDGLTDDEDVQLIAMAAVTL